MTVSPPCQPFSIQGKRLGADDERNCFPAIVEAIREIQPNFIAIENVPGILTCPYRPRSGRTYFRHFLSCLDSCGYNTEWIVIGSGHFGASFLRERLLLVGVSQRLKPKWERATPWLDQARNAVEEFRTSPEGRVSKPGLVREALPFASGMDIPAGVKNGDRATRLLRVALGNALDPRVALKRVLYLSELFATATKR
ncbi:DNA cytosine methyltransferase [Coleofasciculus sp. FACHB-501]|nr:DNA cytosine methyltransferase [Coleofasciculus sp. FACHB-501]